MKYFRVKEAANSIVADIAKSSVTQSILGETIGKIICYSINLRRNYLVLGKIKITYSDQKIWIFLLAMKVLNLSIMYVMSLIPITN